MKYLQNLLSSLTFKAMCISLLTLCSLHTLANEAHQAEVYFYLPHNGATVESPVTIKFGLKGKGVAPAGINLDNTGHHHLLIDLDILPDLTKPLPSSEKIRHFGGGQTETRLELSPGKHTLQLVLGNYMHVPHKTPIISEKITIIVK